MNYTWEITGIKRKDSPDVSNIIVQTYWKKIGTDDDGRTGEFSGATPFDPSSVDPNNFISFDDLTEEIVLGWIQSVVVGDYESHVNEQIQRQIDSQIYPETEETSNFPWSTGS